MQTFDGFQVGDLVRTVQPLKPSRAKGWRQRSAHIVGFLPEAAHLRRAQRTRSRMRAVLAGLPNHHPGFPLAELRKLQDTPESVSALVEATLSKVSDQAIKDEFAIGRVVPPEPITLRWDYVDRGQPVTIAGHVVYKRPDNWAWVVRCEEAFGIGRLAGKATWGLIKPPENGCLARAGMDCGWYEKLNQILDEEFGPCLND